MTVGRDGLARQLAAAVGQQARPDELGQLISDAVAPWVAHDALRLVGTSPTVGLGQGSFSFWHRYETGLVEALLVRHRYLGADPCSPEAIARRERPVGLVGGEHSDRPTRDLLAAQGVGGELRLVLRDARGVWGLLGLVRAEGGKAFGSTDVDQAIRLVPALLSAVRRYVTDGPLTPAVPALPTGVVIVGADHRIRSVSPQARQWLERMWTPQRCAIPSELAESCLIRMSHLARRHAQDPGAPPPLACYPAATFGRWTAIEGQPLDADGTGEVAVVIQSATGAMLLPSLCDWYHVTPRERRVIEQLYQGMAPKQIARRLELSTHTVNDHLKSVFRKTGASGRDELIAALTG